jgi:hypothetical protein
VVSGFWKMNMSISTLSRQRLVQLFASVLSIEVCPEVKTDNNLLYQWYDAALFCIHNGGSTFADLVKDEFLPKDFRMAAWKLGGCDYYRRQGKPTSESVSVMIALETQVLEACLGEEIVPRKSLGWYTAVHTRWNELPLEQRVLIPYVFPCLGIHLPPRESSSFTLDRDTLERDLHSVLEHWVLLLQWERFRACLAASLVKPPPPSLTVETEAPLSLEGHAATLWLDEILRRPRTEEEQQEALETVHRQFQQYREKVLALWIDRERHRIAVAATALLREHVTDYAEQLGIIEDVLVQHPDDEEGDDRYSALMAVWSSMEWTEQWFIGLLAEDAEALPSLPDALAEAWAELRAASLRVHQWTEAKRAWEGGRLLYPSEEIESRVLLDLRSVQRVIEQSSAEFVQHVEDLGTQCRKVLGDLFNSIATTWSELRRSAEMREFAARALFQQSLWSLVQDHKLEQVEPQLMQMPLFYELWTRTVHTYPTLIPQCDRILGTKCRAESHADWVRYVLDKGRLIVSTALKEPSQIPSLAPPL